MTKNEGLYNIGEIKIGHDDENYYVAITPGLTEEEDSKIHRSIQTTEIEAINLPEVSIKKYAQPRYIGSEYADKLFIRYGWDITKKLGNRAFSGILEVIDTKKTSADLNGKDESIDLIDQ